ncbi:response regulator, partial [bacterium]|nr:response regulator [bacterium]
MIRILFVDNNVESIDSLTKTLKDMRNEWHIDFTTTSLEALEAMELYKYHVIITDMQMPVMDGTELLNIVKEKYPHTIRIIQAGFA